MSKYKEIAKVTDNNQKDWENIIETAPYVTLDVGVKLYLKREGDDVEGLDCDLVSIDFEKSTITIQVPPFVMERGIHGGTVNVDMSDILSS